MDQSLRAKFRAELPPIYPRLLARAEQLVSRSHWRQRFNKDRRSVAEDLLHEAVLRSWTTRRWNPEKVDLWGFLVGVMKSLVYEAASSPENRTSSLDEGLRDRPETKADLIADDSSSIEEVYIRAEQAAEIETAVLEAAGDDPVLLKYVEAIMDGAGTQGEIAQHTGLTVTAVYQAHRKLVRRVKARQAKESVS